MLRPPQERFGRAPTIRRTISSACGLRLYPLPGISAAAQHDDAIGDREDVLEVVTDNHYRRPRDRKSSIKRSTFACSRTPSAAVGSSMKMRRPPWCTARAIATACRCPPERSPTRCLHGRDSDLQVVQHFARLPHHAWLVDGCSARRLATKEDVTGDVPVIDESEILVDHGDAERHSIAR